MKKYKELLAIKLPEELDRRRKIPTSEHSYIRERHKNGEGIRELARFYNVDKRLIQFIVYPERYALNKKYYKDREQAKKTYSRVKGEEWARTQREHRRYKVKALKEFIR
jgi:hypothetical protein